MATCNSNKIFYTKAWYQLTMATTGTTTKYSSSAESSSDDMQYQTKGQINLFSQDNNGKTPPPPLPPLPIQQIQMHLVNSFDGNHGEQISNPLNKIPSSWKLKDNDDEPDGDGPIQTTSPKSINTSHNAKLYCIVTYRILTGFLAIYAIIITMIFTNPHNNRIYNICRPTTSSNIYTLGNETDILIFGTVEPTLSPTTDIVKLVENPSVSPSKYASLSPSHTPSDFPTDPPTETPSQEPTEYLRSNATQIPTAYPCGGVYEPACP